jgi:hypothetical protein
VSLGTFSIFTCIQEAAGRRHANARNFKENSGKPLFLLAFVLAFRKRKSGRLPEFSTEITSWYLQDAACANFAK